MLKNVSWTNYLTTILIGLAIYYLFISVRYYSEEIKDLLSGRKKLKLKPVLPQDKRQANVEAQQINEDIADFENTIDEEFDATERLIEQLKTTIANGCRKELIPEEFKVSISKVLKEYPTIKYSPLRPSINELIISEYEKYGATTIDKSEVDLLWREGV